MSYCTPCPPCDTNFPILCEPLEVTTQAKRLVVEDTAACQKTLQTPSSSQQILKSVGGNLSWTSGGNDSILTKNSTGFVELRNGSTSEPIVLPNISSEAADNVPKTLVMLADGTVKVWEPSLTADKFIAYWDGGDWRVNTLNSILPSGQGVLIRDTANTLQIVPNGVSGSSFQMVGTSPQFVAAAPNQLPQGYLFGLTIENNAADPLDTINVTAGRCRSSDNTSDLVLSTSITKKANATWNQGTNEGGLDTGSIGQNQTYHVYVISNASAIDVIFSLSANSPLLPSGFTLYRRIGSFTTSSSTTNIRQFSQIGNRFMYTEKPIKSQDSASVGTGGSPIVLTGIPEGIRVKPIISSQITAAVSWAFFEWGVSTYPSTQIPGVNNTAANTYLRQGQAAAMVGAYNLEIYTDTLRTIGLDVSAAVPANSTGLYIDVYGWYDDRGQYY